jgi:prepilin-type N-terminal cleavage/methylation domain-containing protein
MTSTPSRTRGFTLIELMVTTFIILLLLGIMLPSLSQIRLTAMRHKCMENVRNIAQACLTYAGDTISHRGSVKSALPNVEPISPGWENIDTKKGNAACMWLLVQKSFTSRDVFFCPEGGLRQNHKRPGTEDTSFTYIGGISTLSYSYLSMVEHADETFMGNKRLDSQVVIVGDKNPHYGFNSTSRDSGTLGPFRNNSRNHNNEGQMIGHISGTVEWLPAQWDGATSLPAKANRLYDKNGVEDHDFDYGEIQLPDNPDGTNPLRSLWDDIYSSADGTMESSGKRGCLNDSFLIP